MCKHVHEEEVLLTSIKIQNDIVKTVRYLNEQDKYNTRQDNTNTRQIQLTRQT